MRNRVSKMVEHVVEPEYKIGFRTEFKTDVKTDVKPAKVIKMIIKGDEVEDVDVWDLRSNYSKEPMM